MSAGFAETLERAAAALRAGEPIVVHGDDVCTVAVAAEAIDADLVATFLRDAGGMVAVAMACDRVDALGLPTLSRERDRRSADFTVSVDAVEGTTTGISAADRAATIRALLATEPDGIVVPGHVQAIRAAEGGLASRPNIAEACVELARLAGVQPVIATCEILDEAGSPLLPDRLALHPSFRSAIAVDTRLLLAHLRGFAAVPEPDPGGFRTAMSLLASGVVAITVRGPDERPLGLTVSSASSYTDSPPSVVVSVAHSSRTHDALIAAPGFGFHLLGSDQGALARALASRSDDKFGALDWSWDGDVPRLHGALAYLRCARSALFEHYDHTLVIGDVELTELGASAPLIHYRRVLDWELNQGQAPRSP